MGINMIDELDENSADDFFLEDVDPYTKVRISEIIEKECKRKCIFLIPVIIASVIIFVVGICWYPAATSSDSFHSGRAAFSIVLAFPLLICILVSSFLRYLRYVKKTRYGMFHCRRISIVAKDTGKTLMYKQYIFTVKSLDNNEDTARVSVDYRLYDEAWIGQKGWLIKIDKESSRPWVSPYWIVPFKETPAVVTKLVTDKTEPE